MVTRPQDRQREATAGKPARPKAERKDEGPGSLAGNLTKDPELHYTAGGRPVVSLRVAVSERVKNPKTGEWGDTDPEFFDVTAWGQQAENCAEYLAKGYRIVAEGRWESQTWTDDDGDVQERVVFVARDLGPSMLFKGARVIDKSAAGST